MLLARDGQSFQTSVIIMTIIIMIIIIIIIIIKIIIIIIIIKIIIIIIKIKTLFSEGDSLSFTCTNIHINLI